jgi:hypothetical protein
LDVDLEISALVVARDAEGDVGIANGLRPFVGQGVLLGLLLGLALCLLGGRELLRFWVRARSDMRL